MAIYKEYVEKIRKDILQVEKTNLDDNSILIDIREPYEFEKGAMPNAINIPRGRLEFDIEEHPILKNKYQTTQDLLKAKIVLYCKSDGRSVLAAKSLNDIGFYNVSSLIGGYDNWIK